MKMKKDSSQLTPPEVSWAVPEELGIPPDPLRLRLDFHHQAVVMTLFEEDKVTDKIISAMDIAHALASELSFGSGILPAGTLWWRNTKGGAVVGLYAKPRIRVIALQVDVNELPRRYKIPLPGLIFLCRPGKAPWVYAVKRRPKKETDAVYRAPLANVHANGRSCAGTHRYPNNLEQMEESFFTSFFSGTADLEGRSKKFPKNILRLWEFLDGKTKFPLEDLKEQGTISDLLNMG